MSTWELKEKSCGELTCVVENETWSNAKTKAFAKLAKDVEVPGFRKGQAPKKIVEKRLNRNEVLLEAVNLVANDVLMEGVKEHSLEVIAQPELKLNGLDEDKAELVFVITVKPEVTLGQYKELPMEKDTVEVTEEDVNAELTRLQERFAEMEVKETAENGDTVVIDFEGFKDGVPFEGGKAENYSLVIGSNTFIPGFEEQLIGMDKDSEKEIKVTFPEDYHAENLKGKETTFKVKVHEIKTKENRELNDEFFEDLGMEGVNSLETLKESIKEHLEAHKKTDIENKFVDDMLDAISKQTEIDIPEEMVEDEINHLIKRFEEQLKYQGVSLDLYYSLTKSTEKDLREQVEKEAFKNVLYRLILEELVKILEITVTDEEANEELEKMAKQYNATKEDIQKELGGMDMIKYDIEIRKAFDKLEELNKG